MKKFITVILLVSALILSACATTSDWYTNTKYIDPNTGATVVVVQDANGGYIEYVNEQEGINIRINYIRDEVSGEITYINPENGLETTVGVGNPYGERG